MEIFALNRMKYQQVVIFGMLIFILMYTHSTRKCNTGIMKFVGKAINVVNGSSEVNGTNRLTIDVFPLHLNQFNICAKGVPLIDRELIIRELPNFIKVFEKRPYVENIGGTKFAHQFAVWCTVRKLKPLQIIEWNSSWMFVLDAEASCSEGSTYFHRPKATPCVQRQSF